MPRIAISTTINLQTGRRKCPLSTFPTINGCMQNGSSVGIYTRCIHVFCTFGTDLYAQSMIINKNFCIGAQSKVYEECVVGWVALSSLEQFSVQGIKIPSSCFLFFVEILLITNSPDMTDFFCG